ncbi:CopD family protein [Wenzhouxiangella marina]|uniref:Protoporphyrinogen IX oxidase n=1 Tax=Wenzhouxiangella marina TaxID=1579979 RepID=A0A0K0XTG6_9GAMM|nr:CopD family protein [Wenzhouxiangella marina]AKS40950.1 membrane protein [Wenzhouxiangella marina]MBB6087824.1 putative membrane protein [Wenzhouxiangella marina]
MLWLKAFHLIFVVTWFAGLFYLPRLFVYAAENPGGETMALFKIMQRRLLMITHIGGALAVGFGLTSLAANPGWLSGGWLHAKLVLVAGLIAYHAWCARLVAVFAADRNTHSSRWYRWFNEVPAVFLILIVLLAVVKPF